MLKTKKLPWQPLLFSILKVSSCQTLPSLILRRSRSFAASVTHSLPSPSDILRWSRVHDVIALCEFHPIRANVTLPQKWGMRGMWLCNQIQIQDGGKCGRKHRENLPRFRRYLAISRTRKGIESFHRQKWCFTKSANGFGKSLVFQMAPLVHSGL